jgi:2-amino-4-hydroxy-6-hydroxymethyldihydropteridine diphosphokinase
MTIAYIGLGSNYETETNFKKGMQLLSETFTVTAISPVYESAPVGNSNNLPYLNAAIAIETELQPHELKEHLVAIEDECERVRIDAEGNKSKIVTLDCDLLLYGDAITSYEFSGKTYHLPHDDILKYAHVAIPLTDIAAEVIHPETGQPISAIAAEFTHHGIIHRDDIQIR